MSDSIQVKCTCCDAELTVEPKSGEVLHTKRPKLDAKKSFDTAMQEVRASKQKREDAFSKAFERTQNKDLLNQKFDEARKRADDDPTEKPYNPMDLD